MAQDTLTLPGIGQGAGLHAPTHRTESKLDTHPRDWRTRSAWCEWLAALAVDAEAALAAAIAYRDLNAEERIAWIDALSEDACSVEVPKVALYAPLLAVETDPARRQRIVTAQGPSLGVNANNSEVLAFSARRESGARLSVIVSPLYLDFFQVLACDYRPEAGFNWVRHEPIVERANLPKSGDCLEHATLESTPLSPMVDELASTILSHGRSGRPLPEALRLFANLFEPVWSSPR